MSLKETLEAAIRQATFTSDGVAEEIVSELRPVIGVSTSDAAVTLGASKIGGKPHLPRGTNWPEAPMDDDDDDDDDDDYDDDDDDDDDATRLSFLAQINLADVDSDGAFPNAGLLSIFSTSEEMFFEPEIPSVVIYTEDLSDLVEVDYPPELNKVEGRFKEVALRIGPSFLLVDEDEAISRHDYDDEKVFRDILRDVANSCTSHMLGGAYLWDADLEDTYRDDGDVLVLKLNGDMLERLGDDDSVFSGGSFCLFLAADKARKGAFDDTIVVYEGGS